MNYILIFKNKVFFMNKMYLFLKRDLKLSYFKEGNSLNILIFYFLLIVLYPLGITNSLNILEEFGIGIIWITCFISSLISFDKWLQNDYQNGSLQLLTFQSLPIELIIFLKIICHWLSNQLLLILSIPLVMLFYNINFENIFIIVEVMIYSTICVSFLGSIGSYLTITLHQKGIILSIILIPLYIPLFIFSTLIIKHHILNLEYLHFLNILKCSTFILMVTVPFLNTLIISDNL